MKTPDELRQIADQRQVQIRTAREKEEAAKEKAKAARKGQFFKDHRQKWLDRCEHAIESAADHGRKYTSVQFDPGVQAEGFEERKGFAHALVMEIAGELTRQGFHVSPNVYRLPGDHEGPEIYSITLTIDWSKS